MVMARIIFTTCFLLLTYSINSQSFRGNKYGINIGIHIAAGTHFSRLGISCDGYYAGSNYQLNPGFKLYYNWKNIGPSKKYFEFAPSAGILFSFGKPDSSKNLFFTAVSNQTNKKNSVAYSFNYYLNRIKTSQATGTVSSQFGNFQLITENDLFGGSIRDEFRTGSVLMQFKNKYFQYGINFSGWTGKRGVHKDDPAYPSRNGYMDMSGSLYGNVSGGLLSGYFQYAAPYGQLIQGHIGIDAEQVRNFFQNILVHRLFFSPKKEEWRGGSDLPMLDVEGNMYLYRPGQRIRPVKLYGNLYSNPSLFY